MPALMKFIVAYKGANIFAAAATAPWSYTTAILVHGVVIKPRRIAYKRGDTVRKEKAIAAAKRYIDRETEKIVNP